MSHLGTKIIYDLLNKHPRIALRARLHAVGRHGGRADQAPAAGGVARSAAPLRDFDVVGMSLQYEMTYTNALNLLRLSGIPLRSAERAEKRTPSSSAAA
ncbi:MAG: hypothetical protein U1F43_25160 [Myxococcota bacterium]